MVSHKGSFAFSFFITPVVQGAQVTVGAGEAMHKLQLASALTEPAATDARRCVACHNGHQSKIPALICLFSCPQKCCVPASERAAAPEPAGLLSPPPAAADAALPVVYQKTQQYNRLVCVSFSQFFNLQTR